MGHRSALSAITIVAMLGACSAKDDSVGTGPTPPPPPAPEQETPEPKEQEARLVEATISSVQLLQDCPDAPLPPAKSGFAAPPPPPATPALAPARSRSATPGYRAPCRQSTVQISFVGQGAEATQVSVAQVRLMSSEGMMLSELPARIPSKWQDNGYVSWDQIIPAEGELKAAYKITPPDWSAVESKLGGESYEKMFVVEIDLVSEGKTTTVRSQAITRQHPVAIPT